MTLNIGNNYISLPLTNDPLRVNKYLNDKDIILLVLDFLKDNYLNKAINTHELDSILNSSLNAILVHQLEIRGLRPKADSYSIFRLYGSMQPHSNLTIKPLHTSTWNAWASHINERLNNKICPICNTVCYMPMHIKQDCDLNLVNIIIEI